MTRIICDTNALIFWSQVPERLSKRASDAVARGIEVKTLACSDVSFWEIAMLFAGGRLVKPVTPALFMHDIIAAMKLTVLPITSEIAEISQSDRFPQRDLADRLIAATALYHNAPLVTSDKRLRSLEGLETIW